VRGVEVEEVRCDTNLDARIEGFDIR
jgi:hypothetical protein